MELAILLSLTWLSIVGLKIYLTCSSITHKEQLAERFTDVPMFKTKGRRY
jgi:hypothetical protein